MITNIVNTIQTHKSTNALLIVPIIQILLLPFGFGFNFNHFNLKEYFKTFLSDTIILLPTLNWFLSLGIAIIIISQYFELKYTEIPLKHMIIIFLPLTIIQINCIIKNCEQHILFFISMSFLMLYHFYLLINENNWHISTLPIIFFQLIIIPVAVTFQNDITMRNPTNYIPDILHKLYYRHNIKDVGFMFFIFFFCLGIYLLLIYLVSFNQITHLDAYIAIISLLIIELHILHFCTQRTQLQFLLSVPFIIHIFTLIYNFSNFMPGWLFFYCIITNIILMPIIFETDEINNINDYLKMFVNCFFSANDLNNKIIRATPTIFMLLCFVSYLRLPAKAIHKYTYLIYFAPPILTIIQIAISFRRLEQEYNNDIHIYNNIMGISFNNQYSRISSNLYIFCSFLIGLCLIFCTTNVTSISFDIYYK